MRDLLSRGKCYVLIHILTQWFCLFVCLALGGFFVLFCSFVLTWSSGGYREVITSGIFKGSLC